MSYNLGIPISEVKPCCILYFVECLHLCECMSQYHSITVSQYNSITVSQYNSITVSQYNSITVAFKIVTKPLILSYEFFSLV